jgi:hypothetical protein
MEQRVISRTNANSPPGNSKERESRRAIPIKNYDKFLDESLVSNSFIGNSFASSSKYNHSMLQPQMITTNVI